MRRIGSRLKRRAGSLLVAGAAWVTFAGGPHYLAGVLLFSGLGLDGLRFLIERFGRRARPTLDAFGNPIGLETGRTP